MLGLPAKAEVSKMLPKKAIYEKFNMTAAQKARLDADIARIAIVGELTSATTQIAVGKTVQGFYVLQISLKNKKYDEKVLAGLQRLIPQRMVLLLQYEEEYCLAYYQTRLFATEWQAQDKLTLPLTGLDLDAVWTNTVKSIVCSTESGAWDRELTLDENITRADAYIRTQREIERLEKLARAEKQPKKKFELVQRINAMRNAEFVIRNGEGNEE